jgi:hypothetical protein
MPVNVPGQLGQLMTSFEFHAGLELLLAAGHPEHQFWPRVDEYFDGAAPRLERWIAALQASGARNHAQIGTWSEVAAAKSALRLCRNWNQVADPRSLDRQPLPAPPDQLPQGPGPASPRHCPRAD